jgi:hypothetical protein
VSSSSTASSPLRVGRDHNGNSQSTSPERRTGIPPQPGGDIREPDLRNDLDASTSPSSSVAGERIFALSFAVGFCFLTAQIALAISETRFKSSDPLPDLSGLAWMGEDLFVAVHDAKNPDELDRPRMSILAVPRSLGGVLWRSVDVDFPNDKSNDLRAPQGSRIQTSSC